MFQINNDYDNHLIAVGDLRLPTITNVLTSGIQKQL